MSGPLEDIHGMIAGEKPMSDDLVKHWDDIKERLPIKHDEAAELMFDIADKMADRIEALEAQLAEAVAALEPFAQTLERYSGFAEYSLFGVWEDVNGAAGRKLNILRKQNFDEAAAVLAKLTKAD